MNQAGSIRSFIVGFAVAVTACVALGFADHYALSTKRLAAVIATGFAMAQFEFMPQARISDPFTDCSLLVMQQLRVDDPIANVFRTPFTLDFKYHPCQNAAYLGGVAEQSIKPNLPPVLAYVNYPFGTRHLLSVAFGVLEVFQVRALYFMACCTGAIGLLIGAMRHSDRHALIIVPLVAVLCLAFSFHILGSSFAHAPPIFVGLAMLSVLLFAKDWFRPWHRRVAFFAALGVATSYFDMLNGHLAALPALSIVLNQMFYGETRGWRPVRQAIAIGLIFVAAYVLLTALRLIVLKYGYGDDAAQYFAGLSIRLSSEIGDISVTFGEVLFRLWDFRSMISPLGRDFSGALLGVGAACWIATLVATPTLWRHSPWRADVTALAIASFGIFAWLFLFPNHSYVHPVFVARLLALPAAFGLMAFAMTVAAFKASRAQGSKSQAI